MLGERFEHGDEVECVRLLVETILRRSAGAPQSVHVTAQEARRKVTLLVTTEPTDQLSDRLQIGRSLKIILDAMAESLGIDFTVKTMPSDKPTSQSS